MDVKPDWALWVMAGALVVFFLMFAYKWLELANQLP